MFLFFVFSAANTAEYAPGVKSLEILTTDFLQPHQGFTLEEINGVESINLSALPNKSLKSLAQFLVLRGLDGNTIGKNLAKQQLHKLDMDAKTRAVVNPIVGILSYTNHSFEMASFIFGSFSLAATIPFLGKAHWQAMNQLPKALCHQVKMTCQEGHEIEFESIVGDDDEEFMRLIKKSLDEKSPVMVLLSAEPSRFAKPHEKGAHYSVLVGYQGDNFYVLNTSNQVFLAPKKDLLHAMDWSDTWYKKCVSNYRWLCEGTYGRYIAIR